jgi:hypothetical protein
MADYQWSICEPDDPNIIEKGSILKEQIMETFENYPWMDRLRKISTMKDDDVCFSPSVSFQNLDTEHRVEFSIVGTEADHEFYIFYDRSDITGQTKEDAIKFLEAFLNNDHDYMEAQMK